jgi:membrane protease YdiL (CAAX protease family)
MDKTTQLFKNPILRIIVAILLGLFVLNVVPYVEGLIVLINPHTMNTFTWLIRVAEGVTMLVFSILIILFINKGNLTQYGFTLGKNVRYVKFILLSFIIGIITMLITGIIANILQSLYPVEGGEHFASNYSFLETVFYVWILASISEEVLTRGLIQGFLAPLKKYGFKIFKRYISVPILISALFFGLMHIMLLTIGMNVYMVFAVVITCFILGLVAGYYREKTGSLIPAIIVHAVFNMSGALLGLLG